MRSCFFASVLVGEEEDVVKKTLCTPELVEEKNIQGGILILCRLCAAIRDGLFFTIFNIQVLSLPFEQVINYLETIYFNILWIFIFYCNKINMRGPCSVPVLLVFPVGHGPPQHGYMSRVCSHLPIVYSKLERVSKVPVDSHRDARFPPTYYWCYHAHRHTPSQHAPLPLISTACLWDSCMISDGNVRLCGESWPTVWCNCHFAVSLQFCCTRTSSLLSLLLFAVMAACPPTFQTPSALKSLLFPQNLMGADLPSPSPLLVG